MPRREFARRFEPRYGVSDPMLETEVEYLRREVEDQRVYSSNDLTERLSNRRRDLTVVEVELEFALKRLSDQDRLIVRNLFARDCWYLAKLYERYMRSDQSADTGAHTRQDITDEETGDLVPVMPFKESLFG